jgi:hypothetical protein
MKTITLLLVSAFCLTFASCGRIYGPVEEVKALMEAKDAVILQISKQLDADPTEVGVDEARKAFEAKKGDLKAKRDAINAAPRGMNGDWLSMLSQSEVSDTKMFAAIRQKFYPECMARKSICTTELEKFGALERSFEEATR